MQTIYFTSESERRAVLPDAAEDEAWRERTRLEMPDDNPGNFAPVCDRIHLKASQQSKVPGPKADFIFAAIEPCSVKTSAACSRQPFIPAASAPHETSREERQSYCEREKTDLSMALYGFKQPSGQTTTPSSLR